MVHQTLTQPHTFSRSEGNQCPTTDSSRNCVIGAEPGIAVSGNLPFFSPVREALFNTLRKYVHRGQKDSVIGTLTTYALVNEKHLDQPNEEAFFGRQNEDAKRATCFPPRGRSAAYCSRQNTTLWSTYLSYLQIFIIFLAFTNSKCKMELIMWGEVLVWSTTYLSNTYCFILPVSTLRQLDLLLG